MDFSTSSFKRDRGLETLCAWIFVSFLRVFIFSIVWSGLLSFRWTSNMLSEHLLSWIQICCVMSKPRTSTEFREGCDIQQKVIAEFYWERLTVISSGTKSKDTSKVCRLNPSVNMKEKLTVSLWSRTKVFQNQPAQLAKLLQDGSWGHSKSWKTCLHSKAFKVDRQMLQRRLDGAVTVVAVCAELGFLDGHECTNGGGWRRLTALSGLSPPGLRKHTQNQKDTISATLLNMEAASWRFLLHGELLPSHH